MMNVLGFVQFQKDNGIQVFAEPLPLFTLSTLIFGGNGV